MYFKCSVINNVVFNSRYGKIRLKAPEIAKGAKPGQFVMLRCWEGNTPFLPRPFSINLYDRDEGIIDILYKIVGSGTKNLSRLRENDYVMLEGPLGNGFTIPDNASAIAVVGRGIGIAPMLALTIEAVNRHMEVYAFLSASSKEYLFDKEKLKGLGAKVYSMYDSLHGDKMVTDYMAEVLETNKIDAVYVCGSNRLIRETIKLKDKYGFTAYASLEETMACGIGACKGCVCKTRNSSDSTRYERVCKEGPVFPVERLVI